MIQANAESKSPALFLSKGLTLSKQIEPSFFISLFDQNPLFKCAAGGSEGKTSILGDQLLDAISGEFDDEVAAAVVAGAEELAFVTETGEAHKAALCHVILAEEVFGQSPEEVGFWPFLTLCHALFTASKARTRSIQALVLLWAGSMERRSATKRTGLPSG